MKKEVMLSSEELSNRIFEDYEGMNFIGYKFDIPESPMVRVSKNNPDNVYSCTCRFHSVKDIHFKKDCRYTRAYKLKREKEVEVQPWLSL